MNSVPQPTRPDESDVKAPTAAIGSGQRRGRRAALLTPLVLLVPGAAALAGPLGMPGELLLAAGAMLIPLGLFIGWLGTRHS